MLEVRDYRPDKNRCQATIYDIMNMDILLLLCWFQRMIVQKQYLIVTE
jgi:hypothetical protein